MPCRDDGYDVGPSLQQRNDELARMLCQACTALENLGQIRNVSVPLTEWWEAHKVADARRQAEEWQREVDESMKRQVLRKLTPLERKLLGL